MIHDHERNTWRHRTPWCRAAARCTAPTASSATWCPPTRWPWLRFPA